MNAKGCQQCYNGQAAVDKDSRLIVAVDLSDRAPDNGQLLPMLEQAQANTQKPVVSYWPMRLSLK